MDNKNKTPLEEAKASYEQIKEFATEAVKKEFENDINEKVNKILNESLSINVDDSGEVTVETDKKVIELNNNGEVEVEDKQESDEKMTTGNDDDEEIEIEKNIDEMTTLEQTQQNPEATPEVAPTDASAISTPEVAPETAPEAVSGENTPPVDDDVLKLAQLLTNIIDKRVGGTDTETEQGVDYIDDEKTVNPESPTPAPETSAVSSTPAPVQEEDDLLEFSLDEIKDENMLEFEIPTNEDNKEDDFIEYDPEAMLTAAGDISKENPNWKKDVNKDLNLPELEEMKGQSKLVRNTSNRLGLEPRDGTPNLQESNNKIKTQYESKIDELLKENKSLKESNKEFGEIVENYQNAFKDLRKQFDVMQSFNAKLAFANKIFASGGLSVADKARIAEEFDKTKTAEEAQSLYNKILEENKIIINKDNSSKIKATTTNTAKPKDIVFESAEMKRRNADMKRTRVLAGIEKDENYI
jgi:hypothetical protein